MVKNRIYIKVTYSTQAFNFSVRYDEGSLEFDLPFVRGVFLADGHWNGPDDTYNAELATALSIHLLEDTGFKRSFDQWTVILLELDDVVLSTLSWEEIFGLALENGISDRTSDNRIQVVRLMASKIGHIYTPFKLPISTLVLPPPVGLGKEFILPSPSVMRYFEVLTMSNSTISRLEQVLSSQYFNIVQISAKFDRIQNVDGGFSINGDDEYLEFNTFHSLLEKSKTRLLILHSFSRDVVHDALSLFAFKLAAISNVNIITYYGDITDSKLFDDIYIDIVHDYSLFEIFSKVPRTNSPAFYLQPGGEDALRASRMVDLLTKRLEKKIDTAKELQSIIRKAAFESRRARLWYPAFEREYIARSLNTDNINLNFARETKGYLPLAEIQNQAKLLQSEIKRIERYTTRVVNSWFRQENRIVPSNEGLVPNDTYKFILQIGPVLAHSNNRTAAPIPEAELEKAYKDGGVSAQATIFSNDFDIQESTKDFMIPSPPFASEAVEFQVTCPKVPNVARLRVGIYINNNLIQSLIVMAQIGIPKLSPGIGNLAEVDYALNRKLTGLKELPGKTLNIAVNDSGEGTHSIFIHGTQIRRQYNFTDGEISGAIKTARSILQEICSIEDSDGDRVYQYSSDNNGTLAKLDTDLRKLSACGSDLFMALGVSHSKQRWRELNDALKAPKCSIQISSTKSSSLVFPWAIVYDKPLIQGSNNKICDQFLNDLKSGNGSISCIDKGCPHLEETDVICPSGFWGLKHIIEQPPSLPGEDEGGGEHQEDSMHEGVNELPDQIKVKGEITSMLMGVSLELQSHTGHEQQLSKLSNLNLSVRQSKTDIYEGLKLDNQVVYFYCHGGRDKQQVWLKVGRNEYILPKDIFWWANYLDAESPFVFINGCETVNMAPEDFTHFTKAFIYLKASGVMGTEITIPETLGSFFASGFLERFLKGISVGEALYEQRLVMLQKKNLMGLVYTPYCHSRLKIIHSQP